MPSLFAQASFEDLQAEIRQGNALQICTKGHYIACGDTTEFDMLYSDSWNRKGKWNNLKYGWILENNGWNERLTKEMYQHEDTCNLVIIYNRK